MSGAGEHIHTYIHTQIPEIYPPLIPGRPRVPGHIWVERLERLERERERERCLALPHPASPTCTDWRLRVPKQRARAASALDDGKSDGAGEWMGERSAFSERLPHTVYYSTPPTYILYVLSVPGGRK